MDIKNYMNIERVQQKKENLKKEASTLTSEFDIIIQIMLNVLSPFHYVATDRNQKTGVLDI